MHSASAIGQMPGMVSYFHTLRKIYMKILIAGFQHETNTFVALHAGYENFVNGETFPALKRGLEIFTLRDVNIPVGGFIKEIERDGHQLVPVVWAGAGPSAQVRQDAFELIAGEIVEAARTEQADAIYMDLHGAMVVEQADDGEGELLERLRRAVGEDVAIIATVDLHANVTERMLQLADAIVSYRTYPHVDMAITGQRAAKLMRERLNGSRWHCAWRKLPFLIPLNSMCTQIEPAYGAYRRLEAIESAGLASLSFALGFPAADFPECGPTIWGYSADTRKVESAVAALAEELVASEASWQAHFLSPEEAVEQALQLSKGASKPVVIADTQDNPGAGGESNTTGMLRALISKNAQDAAFGVVYDPDAARCAHESGIGAFIDIPLGGDSGLPNGERFRGNFEVVSLSDGVCRFDGPMLNGMDVKLGPAALLKIGGVPVVVSSEHPPPDDGTEPISSSGS